MWRGLTRRKEGKKVFLHAEAQRSRRGTQRYIIFSAILCASARDGWLFGHFLEIAEMGGFGAGGVGCENH